MFGNKKLKEEIAELKHELADLKNIVKTQELIKLRNENASLKETVSLINSVHLHVKSTAIDPEDDNLIIRYEPLVLKIVFDEEGKPQKNETFYAINKLRLISLEDMKKVQSALDSAREK